MKLTAIATALTAAFLMLAGGAGVRAEPVAGTWDLWCCGNAYHWTLTVDQESGDTFSGNLFNLNTRQPDGHVRGHQSYGRIEFDRTVPGGGQHWTANLVGEGPLRRMADGRWTGLGSDMGMPLDFHAERPGWRDSGASSSAPPLPDSPDAMAGTWDVWCCGNAYHWSMTIDREAGDTFSGRLFNLKTNQADGLVAGRRTGSHVEFDRTVGGGGQHWTAELTGRGAQERLVAGRWSGTGADMGFPLDFHAERPGATTAGSPPASDRAPQRPGGSSSAEGPVGEPVTLFETWNTAGCGFTDTAELPLAGRARVDRFQVWYNWHAGETSVPFRLLIGGQTIAHGDMVRGGCDPYQSSWCVAEAAVALDLEAGDYVLRLDSARICQNAGSQGRGFIKATGQRREHAD